MSKAAGEREEEKNDGAGKNKRKWKLHHKRGKRLKNLSSVVINSKKSVAIFYFSGWRW